MKKFILTLFLFVLFCTDIGSAWSAQADRQSERRSKAGIKLFRAMLAADLDISRKVRPEGNLALLIVYNSDGGAAEALAAIVDKGRESGKQTFIRKLPVSVETVGISSLDQYLKRSFAGIFVAEPLKEETLQQLIAISMDRKIILYSPFEGDVERGVLGGISVEAKVQPYVNIKALKQSGIRIKPFFMKVSKSYE